jgi:hypothetical protein
LHALCDPFSGSAAGSHCYYRSRLLLAHGSDRGEHPDIAVVPIGAQAAAGCQFVVIQPFSAQVPDGHAAAKMEESRVRLDRNSAGVQVAKFRQYTGWQVSGHMLLDALADWLWACSVPLKSESHLVPKKTL